MFVKVGFQQTYGATMRMEHWKDQEDFYWLDVLCLSGRLTATHGDFYYIFHAKIK